LAFIDFDRDGEDGVRTTARIVHESLSSGAIHCPSFEESETENQRDDHRTSREERQRQRETDRDSQRVREKGMVKEEVGQYLKTSLTDVTISSLAPVKNILPR
jgi:hypothetical protein